MTAGAPPKQMTNPRIIQLEGPLEVDSKNDDLKSSSSQPLVSRAVLPSGGGEGGAAHVQVHERALLPVQKNSVVPILHKNWLPSGVAIQHSKSELV